MTHTTEKERAEFEAWFDDWRRSTWHPLPSDIAKGKAEMPTHWNENPKRHMQIAWQASRRAQAVPQGGKLVQLSVLSDARDTAMQWCINGRVPECGAFAQIAQDLDAMLAAAPQPPEAAPVQLPEYGIDTANHAGIRVRGYTEQQVRELLANHGIQEQNT